MTFKELDLDEKLLSAIEEQHFHKPTDIQALAIPEMLMQKDVLAGAATGTGKTAAFVLPALQFLIDAPQPSRTPRILILAPTRELAIQIHKVVKQLGHYCQFTTAVVTGGFAQDKQLSKLQDEPIDILVATPGRLLNIMSQEYIDLSDVEMVIIDEADRMLDMGQGPDVLAMLEAVPADFQGACFSATLAGMGVANFAKDILEDPIIIQVDAPNQQSQQVQQFVYFADSKAHKRALLKALLEDASCERTIIFCNTKEMVIELAEWLLSQDILNTPLHGDLIQAKRLEKLQKFRLGKIQVLVATDVASRGIDIDNITHVINYDIPFRGDSYIHRIGRTGRALNVGIAYNLVEAHDLIHLRRIEYHVQNKIPVASIEGLEPQFKLNNPPKANKKPHKKKLAKKAAKAKLTKPKKKKGARPSRPKEAE